MKENNYLVKLAKLIQINSTSPLADDALTEVSSYLANWGFVKGNGSFWLRAGYDEKSWVYSHIDTKPALPLDKWQSDPWTLVQQDEKLIGLGISDAKFQLLNLLESSIDFPGNIIIDGGEEIGDAAAPLFLRECGAKRILIVDGSSQNDDFFSGTMGQVDGVIALVTGEECVHPARRMQYQIARELNELTSFILNSGLHFNFTGIHSPRQERSLTMECVDIRFDLRYGPNEIAAVTDFLQRWQPQLKQHYPPFGRDKHDMSRAVFSCALGTILDPQLDVVVVPGARPDNGNHKPNEFICMAQIAAHQSKLHVALVKFLEKL